MPRKSWKKFLSKFKAVRFVSINTKHKSFQIYNCDLFTYKDGVWYSKTNIFVTTWSLQWRYAEARAWELHEALQGQSICEKCSYSENIRSSSTVSQNRHPRRCGSSR